MLFLKPKGREGIIEWIVSEGGACPATRSYLTSWRVLPPPGSPPGVEQSRVGIPPCPPSSLMGTVDNCRLHVCDVSCAPAPCSVPACQQALCGCGGFRAAVLGACGQRVPSWLPASPACLVWVLRVQCLPSPSFGGAGGVWSSGSPCPRPVFPESALPPALLLRTRGGRRFSSHVSFPLCVLCFTHLKLSFTCEVGLSHLR